MRPVAGVFPGPDVVERAAGLCGAALGENVSLLVTGVQKAGAGRVILVPDDVSDGRETGAFPGVEKSVDAVPAVKRNAEGVGLQDAVEVVEGAEERFPAGCRWRSFDRCGPCSGRNTAGRSERSLRSRLRWS